MRKPIPLWIAEVKKQLSMSGKTQKDLADELDMNYQYIRSLLSDGQRSPSAKKRICDHLNIKDE